MNNFRRTKLQRPISRSTEKVQLFSKHDAAIAENHSRWCRSAVPGAGAGVSCTCRKVHFPPESESEQFFATTRQPWMHEVIVNSTSCLHCWCSIHSETGFGFWRHSGVQRFWWQEKDMVSCDHSSPDSWAISAACSNGFKGALTPITGKATELATIMPNLVMRSENTVSTASCSGKKKLSLVTLHSCFRKRFSAGEIPLNENSWHLKMETYWETKTEQNPVCYWPQFLSLFHQLPVGKQSDSRRHFSHCLYIEENLVFGIQHSEPEDFFAVFRKTSLDVTSTGTMCFVSSLVYFPWVSDSAWMFWSKTWFADTIGNRAVGLLVFVPR